MIFSIQKLFLELLCAAIWNRPADHKLFENLDDETWKLLSRLANRQSSGALIADKILSLPEQCLPQQNQIILLATQIRSVEKMNRQLDELLIEISKEYEQLGIPVILLKGRANAQNYPNPLLRAVGDLDLFLYRDGDFEKANQWVKDRKLVYHIDMIRNGHMAFEMDNFIIENHKHITFFEINKYNKILLAEIKKIVQSDGFSSVEIKGKQIKILPAELNAFYIFLHLFFHFVHSGVSFRQFCDWILFLHKHHKEINPESFAKLAGSFKLLYPMQLFALTAIKYLKAPREIFPFQLINNTKYPHKILSEILRGGNFGFYHVDNNQTLWQRRWRKYTAEFTKALRFVKIAPSYIIPVPIMSMINRIKLTIRGH